MALSVGNTASGEDINSSAFSCTLNVDATANLVVVGVGIRHDGAEIAPPTSVTVGGDTCTEIVTKNITGNYSSLWYKTNPSTGNQTVTANYSDVGGDDYQVIGAVAFIGASTTTPYENAASATGTSSTPNVNVTSETGSIVIDCVSSSVSQTTTLTVGTNQTQRVRDASTGGYLTGGQRELFGMSTEAGVTTTAMGWTFGVSTEWGACGASIKAAATGEPAPLKEFDVRFG